MIYPIIAYGTAIVTRCEVYEDVANNRLRATKRNSRWTREREGVVNQKN